MPKQKKVNTTIIKPREKTVMIRERSLSARKRLPENWIPVFLYFHPEYTIHRHHLTMVGTGRVADEDVVFLMEQLADKLEQIKKAS